MDSFTLNKLEFSEIRRILRRYCSSGLGMNLAGRVGPSRRPEIVRMWLTQTSEMADCLVTIGPPPFGGITDVTASLDRAKPGGGGSGEDFASIAATLEGCGAVRQWAGKLGENRPLLSELSAGLGEFDDEVEAIRRVVDGAGEVKDTASDRLSSIRREMDLCQQQIREIVYAFTRRKEVSQYLQTTAVQLHEDRYVLPVKAEHRGRLPGVVHRASQSGATVFVEPSGCVQLNNRLVDLRDRELDEVRRLLNQLAIRVHRRDEEIRQTLRTLAQIDLLNAKAQYAYQFNMHCPRISEDGVLQFHQGRHPLLIEQAYQQELNGVPAAERHAVVPIDMRLGKDFRLLIITGSNTGGKTVALKTVGLLTLMAQSGMHVPASRGAVFPIFQDVLLDVGDEQSLEQSLSTFGGHLKRIRHILRRASSDCLVLLDELGSGTDPDEGGAIGQAILDELRSIGCPGMVTTHLGVLKAYAYNHEGVDNASVEFDTQTLRPTYRLLIGQPGESHAIVVAEHYGLSRRLIRSARKHLPRQANQLRRAIAATAATRAASEEALAAAQAAQAQAQQQQEQYQRKLTDLESVSRRFSEWVGSLPAMKPGDEVFVRSFQRMGRLVRLELSRQVAVVSMGAVEVEVPLQELMPDLDDAGTAGEIMSLRRRLAETAQQLARERDEAEKLRKDHAKKAQAIQQRQHRLESWLEGIASMTVGERVTFAGGPGEGVLVELDWPAGKAKIEVDGKTFVKAFQELFPETGAFGHKVEQGRGRRGGAERPEEAEDGKNRPISRGRPDSRRARGNREVLLSLPPSSQVYVVPFRRRATLVRVDGEKDTATVQSGAFEMTVPLADLQPIRDKSDSSR